jgi:hypothetical protein
VGDLALDQELVGPALEDGDLVGDLRVRRLGQGGNC